MQILTSETMEAEAARLNAEKWQSLARAGKKVEAIREVRTQTRIGLKEAKAMVEEYLAMTPPNQKGEGVKTTTIQLGGGGYLTVVDNGHFAIIQHTNTVAINIPSDELLQEIADIVTRITCRGPTG